MKRVRFRLDDALILIAMAIIVFTVVYLLFWYTA